MLNHMSKLVRGDQLPSDLRREILASYPYRWTSDNRDRERVWRSIEGAPTIPLVSDEQWLHAHAFYVTDRGTLDKRKKHAEPAYMIETEKPSKPHHATKKKSPAQLQREIDEVLAKPGAYSYEEAMAALEKKHAGVPRGGSLRSGHAPVVPKIAHATMKTDATSASTGGPPSKEKLQQAAKWIRRELNKRDDGTHPSHLAAKVLEEADQKFGLGSFGVEGWAKSPSIGYQYLNYGDSYDPTIVVRSNRTQATVIVALGGWASYA